MNDIRKVIANGFKRFTVDGQFYVAFDYTGVYVFTTSDDYDARILEFKSLKDDLALKEHEVTLCYVGNQGQRYQNKVPLDALESWIITNVAGKQKIFTKEDIDELDDCYEIEEEEFNSKVSIMREYNLTDEQIYYVLNHEINNVKQLEKIGVTHAEAVSVFHFLQRLQSVNINDKDESGIKLGVSVYLTDYARKYAALSIVWCMICAALLYGGAVFLPINKQIVGIVLLVIESFSIFWASIAIRSDDLVVAKVSIFVTTLLMLLTVVSCYGQNILSILSI